MKTCFKLLLIAVLVSSTAFTSDRKYTLTVQIEGIKVNEGHILLSLFQGEEGFPSDSKKAIAYANGLVKDNTAILSFQDLPPGIYAVAALHDANSNGKMDTNIFGIPKEAYGSSNDASSRFGAPKYEDAKFELTENSTIKITMRSIF